MNLKTGTLYKINRFFWVLFPTKEDAAGARPVAAPTTGDASTAAVLASYWSISCNVSFIGEGDTIMVVEVSDIQVKVINQEGKSGWINFPADEKWTKGTITMVSF